MSYTPKDCIDTLIYLKNNPTVDVENWGIKELDITDITIFPILQELLNAGLIDQKNKITEKGRSLCPN
jgi:predicted transcriptional regulator